MVDLNSFIGKQFSTDCPYCLTKSVAFTICHLTKWSDSPPSFDVYAECAYPSCGRGVIAIFRIIFSDSLISTIMSGPARVVPASPSSDAPLYTPDPTARFFKQGRNSNMSGDWDAAGAMFRKALDVGLKDKFPDLSGTLFVRIQQAKEEGLLTSELAEWSHEIRIEGNQAVHDKEEYPEEDAKQLEAFTDMLFRYLFTLPGMLKANRENLASQEGEK